MAEIRKINRDNQPDRCQGNDANGQCQNVAHEESDYCLAHGGNKAGEAKNKQALNNYRLTKWHAQVQLKSDSTGIKSLRDEIGILRVLMEEKLNKCEDTNDLLLASGAISDLVLKIEKVVSSCHRLEGSMNQLMDKSAIIQFASEVISIISNKIDDEKILDSIANEILSAISKGQDDDS